MSSNSKNLSSFSHAGYTDVTGNTFMPKSLDALPIGFGVPGGPGLDDCQPGYDKFKLLLHFDGLDNDTTTIDSSSNQFPVSLLGGGRLDDLVVRFGTTSFEGFSVSSYVDVDPLAFDVGTGDFTLETWVFVDPNALDGDKQTIFYAQGDNSFELGFGDTLGLADRLFLTIGGITYVTDTVLLDASTAWMHIAVTRESGLLRLYVNGVVKRINTDLSTTYTLSTFTSNLDLTLFSEITIGKDGPGSNAFFGWIDEFLISSEARYNSGFDTPITAYGDKPEQECNLCLSYILYEGEYGADEDARTRYSAGRAFANVNNEYFYYRSSPTQLVLSENLTDWTTVPNPDIIKAEGSGNVSNSTFTFLYEGEQTTNGTVGQTLRSFTISETSSVQVTSKTGWLKDGFVRSTDGGATWQVVSNTIGTGDFPLDADTYISGLTFVGETLWMSVIDLGPRATFHYSSGNYGSSWSQVEIGQIAAHGLGVWNSSSGAWAAGRTNTTIIPGPIATNRGVLAFASGAQDTDDRATTWYWGTQLGDSYFAYGTDGTHRLGIYRGGDFNSDLRAVDIQPVNAGFYLMPNNDRNKAFMFLNGKFYRVTSSTSLTNLPVELVDMLDFSSLPGTGKAFYDISYSSELQQWCALWGETLSENATVLYAFLSDDGDNWGPPITCTPTNLPFATTIMTSTQGAGLHYNPARGRWTVSCLLSNTSTARQWIRSVVELDFLPDSGEFIEVTVPSVPVDLLPAPYNTGTTSGSGTVGGVQAVGITNGTISNSGGSTELSVVGVTSVNGAGATLSLSGSTSVGGGVKSVAIIDSRIDITQSTGSYAIAPNSVSGSGATFTFTVGGTSGTVGAVTGLQIVDGTIENSGADQSPVLVSQSGSGTGLSVGFFTFPVLSGGGVQSVTITKPTIENASYDGPNTNFAVSGVPSTGVGAQFIVDGTRPRFAGDTARIDTVYITTVGENYQVGGTFQVIMAGLTAGGIQTPAEFQITGVNGAFGTLDVLEANILSPGSGYQVGDLLYYNTSTTTGTDRAILRVTSVTNPASSSTNLTSVSVTNPGNNYQVGDTFWVYERGFSLGGLPNFSSGAQFQVTEVTGGTETTLTQALVTQAGSGYSVGDTFQVGVPNVGSGTATVTVTQVSNPVEVTPSDTILDTLYAVNAETTGPDAEGDFFKYDPLTTSWTQITFGPNVARPNANNYLNEGNRGQSIAYSPTRGFQMIGSRSNLTGITSTSRFPTGNVTNNATTGSSISKEQIVQAVTAHGAIFNAGNDVYAYSFSQPSSSRKLSSTNNRFSAVRIEGSNIVVAVNTNSSSDFVVNLYTLTNSNISESTVTIDFTNNLLPSGKTVGYSKELSAALAFAVDATDNEIGFLSTSTNGTDWTSETTFILPKPIVAVPTNRKHMEIYDAPTAGDFILHCYTLNGLNQPVPTLMYLRTCENIDGFLPAVVEPTTDIPFTETENDTQSGTACFGPVIKVQLDSSTIIWELINMAWDADPFGIVDRVYIEEITGPGATATFVVEWQSGERSELWEVLSLWSNTCGNVVEIAQAEENTQGTETDIYYWKGVTEVLDLFKCAEASDLDVCFQFKTTGCIPVGFGCVESNEFTSTTSPGVLPTPTPYVLSQALNSLGWDWEALPTGQQPAIILCENAGTEYFRQGNGGGGVTPIVKLDSRKVGNDKFRAIIGPYGQILAGAPDPEDEVINTSFRFPYFHDQLDGDIVQTNAIIRIYSVDTTANGDPDTLRVQISWPGQAFSPAPADEETPEAQVTLEELLGVLNDLNNSGIHSFALIDIIDFPYSEVFPTSNYAWVPIEINLSMDNGNLRSLRVDPSRFNAQTYWALNGTFSVRVGDSSEVVINRGDFFVQSASDVLLGTNSLANWNIDPGAVYISNSYFDTTIATSSKVAIGDIDANVFGRTFEEYKADILGSDVYVGTCTPVPEVTPPPTDTPNEGGNALYNAGVPQYDLANQNYVPSVGDGYLYGWELANFPQFGVFGTWVTTGQGSISNAYVQERKVQFPFANFHLKWEDATTSANWTTLTMSSAFQTDIVLNRLDAAYTNFNGNEYVWEGQYQYIGEFFKQARINNSSVYFWFT